MICSHNSTLRSAMNLDLSEKRALVCGASAGIGHACAIALAHLGARVTLVARDPTRLAAAVAQLPKVARADHDMLVLDLSDPQGAGRAVEEYIAKAGAIHILINNTGGPPPGAMADATISQLAAAFSSLLLSAHALTQAVIPGMKAEGYGRIINISSTSVKQPIPNLGLSNAVRAAVSNWGKTLATELAPFGITVNSVLPGFVRTDRLTEIFKARSAKSGTPQAQLERDAIAEIPVGRFAHPHEIADAVAFLASPAAGYINGIQLPVDGGRLKGL